MAFEDQKREGWFDVIKPQKLHHLVANIEQEGQSVRAQVLLNGEEVLTEQFRLSEPRLLSFLHLGKPFEGLITHLALHPSRLESHEALSHFESLRMLSFLLSP